MVVKCNGKGEAFVPCHTCHLLGEICESNCNMFLVFARTNLSGEQLQTLEENYRDYAPVTERRQCLGH